MAFQGKVLKIQESPVSIPSTGPGVFQGSVLTVKEPPKPAPYVPPVTKEAPLGFLEKTAKEAKLAALTIRYLPGTAIDMATAAGLNRYFPEALDETLGISKGLKEKGVLGAAYNVLYTMGEAMATAPFKLAKGIIAITDPELAERMIPEETIHPTELLLRMIGKEEWIKTVRPIQIGPSYQKQMGDWVAAGGDPALGVLMIGSNVIFDGAITGGIAEGILRSIAKPPKTVGLKVEEARSILEVSKEATPVEVQKAYYQKAHLTHPDKVGGSAVEFQKVNKAYQALTGIEPTTIRVSDIAYDLIKERPYPWQKIAKESVIAAKAAPPAPKALPGEAGAIKPISEVPPAPPIVPKVEIKPVAPVIPVVEAKPVVASPPPEVEPIVPKAIPPELQPLAQEARSAKNVNEFVASTIFEKSLAGEETKALESFAGETTADKLSTFYNQAVKGVKEVKPEVGRPFELKGLPAKGQVLRNIESAEKELRKAYKPAAEKVNEELGKFWAELEMAEAGERIPIREARPDVLEGEIVSWLGKTSSFPKWIPEDLRKKDLLNEVMAGLTDINNIKYPVGNRSAQRELYNIILDELDARVGIDTTEIRDRILDSYEEIPKAEISEAVGEGAPRRAELAPEEEIKVEEIFPKAKEVKPEIPEKLKDLAKWAETFTKKEFRNVIHRATESKERTVEQQKIVDSLLYLEEMKLPKPVIENFWELVNQVEKDIKFYENKLKELEKYTPEEFARISAGASLEAEKTIFREALMKLRARIGVEEKPKEVSKKGERIFGYSLTGQFELEIFKKLGEFRVFDKDKALTILDTEKEARAFIDAYVDGFEKGVRKDFEPSKRAGLFYLKDENKNIVVRTDEEGVLDAYIDGYNSGVDRKLGATEMEKDEPFSEKEVVREPTGEISEKTAREIVIDDLKSNLDSTPNEFLKSYGGMSGEDYSIGYDGYQWDQPQAKPNYEAIEMHKKNIAELEKKVAIATARGKDSFRQALDNEKFLLEWEEDALRKRNIDKVFFTDERTEKKYEFSLKELWAEAGGKDFEFKPEITDLLGEERGYYLKGKEVKMPVKGGRWKVGEKEYTRSDLEFLAKRTSLTIGRKVTPAEYLHELMKEQESIGKKVSEEQKKYEIQRETRKKFSFIGETSVVRIKLEENGYLLTKNAKIESPTDVAFIFSELKNESREKAFAVNLDADNKIINVDYMSLGSTNAGLINPKEVFRSGVISGAKSIYLIHNHPTGDVSPSSDDLDIFLRLRRVAEILDIKWNGAIIMDRSEFGFVSKDNVETIPYKETKEGKEIIRVVEPKQVIKNPFLAKQIINSPDKAAGLTRAILHKDTNAILAIYLDTRLGVVEIDVKAFSLDNVDYKTFAKDLIKGAMLNNATGLVITSNAELSEKISFFQEVDSMFKFADLELMDVVQVSVNLRESLIDVIRPRKIGGKEEPMMKEKYREIPLTPEELQAFDYVQNRLPMPENLKPAMEMLKKRGLLRADYISPTEPPKITKAARRKVPLGTIKEEQIAKIKLAAEEKKLSRETFAQLRNGFTGHNRTKLEELSTEQADQLFKEILDLTPDKMGKIRLVDAETLEVMKDFIPPGLLTKRAITTGDIFNNLTEPQVSYIVSLFRPIRKVLTSGELLPNEKKVSERIYDDISLAEEDRNIEYRDWHKKYAELYKSARKKDKNVDVNVFGYIEQDWEVPVKTKELAEFLKDFYSASLPVMKPLRVRQKYITHTAPTFWETVKKIGLKGTLKQIIEPNIAREERIDPGIIINLEYIVSKEKFNPFALPRSEYTAYSKKLRKSVNAYASLYFYKNNFDPIMPKVLKRSQFLPPETQKYVKKYLQTVGGRPIGHELWRGPFGRTAKSLINMGVRFEYGILLGANVPSSLGNAAGGTWNNISDIPPDLLALGNKRLSTKQGRRILDKYRLTEQTLWLEPVGGVIERMSKAERGLFVLMQGGEFYMRGSAALARIPEDEFQSGNLSPRTRAIIRRQIGRTQGLFGPAQAPLLSQFTLLRPVWMFKHWMVNEMELWNNFIKEAVSRAKRNPGWRGKIIGNAGVRKILKYIIIGALFYLFGPEFLKKEMRQKIMIPAQLIATLTNWADSVPLVEDLILAENLSVRIANREFNEAREDFINWVKTKGSIKKFADLLEGIQKGTVSSPDGLLKEYLEPQEAIKRFFLGTWTEKGQKEQKLNEELSKLLPFESYTKWDQAFGARKVKTDYQKIKEDILQYIEKKKYWTPPEKEGESGTLALDQQILRMYAIYNGKALKRLDNFFTDAEKLTGQKIEDKEKDSLRMKVTIQEKDIANWVQTKYEQEMIPRLLRRVK